MVFRSRRQYVCKFSAAEPVMRCKRPEKNRSPVIQVKLSALHICLCEKITTDAVSARTLVTMGDLTFGSSTVLAQLAPTIQ